MKTKNIKQTASFKGSPRDLYEMLMDSKKHAAFSGAPARISRKIGAKFIVYGGWINGKNLKLVPGKMIVQTWRGKDWPKGHFSTVSFAFTKMKTGTKLTFRQIGVPADKYIHINKGWKNQYWKKMKAMLAGKKPLKAAAMR